MVASDSDDALDSARGLVLGRAIDGRVDDSDGVAFNRAICMDQFNNINHVIHSLTIRV